VKDFSTGQSDQLNIADLLVGYDPMTDLIEDFVTFTNSGSNTQMFVDRDGSGTGGYSAAQMALIHGVTNLDAEDLETGGYSWITLIAATVASAGFATSVYGQTESTALFVDDPRPLEAAMLSLIRS
jgi:hypothetical protein